VGFHVASLAEVAAALVVAGMEVAVGGLPHGGRLAEAAIGRDVVAGAAGFRHFFYLKKLNSRKYGI
jgi:hypothetical protein